MPPAALDAPLGLLTLPALYELQLLLSSSLSLPAVAASPVRGASHSYHLRLRLRFLLQLALFLVERLAEALRWLSKAGCACFGVAYAAGRSTRQHFHASFWRSHRLQDRQARRPVPVSRKVPVAVLFVLCLRSRS